MVSILVGRKDYKIDTETSALIGAPCACYADTHEGHFLCSSVPEELLRAEAKDVIYRLFDGDGWQWFWTGKYPDDEN